MRIEVLVGNEDPLVFPLKSPKMVLGSHENCDVVLPASGVSRKHLIILAEGDRFFVADQGSTNGSFINEERLIPGRKTEFTSFFPVRLGDNVLVSLLSDEEDLDEYFSNEVSAPKVVAPANLNSDATKVISLKDLSKVRTQDLVVERNQKREIRKKAVAQKKPVKKKKKPTSITNWFAIFIIVGAVYYKFVYLKDSDDTEIDDVQSIQAPKTAAQVETLPDGPGPTVDLERLPTKEEMDKIQNNLKCTIDIEKYLCETIVGAKEGVFGASQIGLSSYVLLDGTAYFEQAKKLIESNDPDLVRETAAFIFLSRSVPLLNETILGETEVFIGLMVKNENGFLTDTVIAFKPAILNANRGYFREIILRYLRIRGKKTFAASKKIYTVY